VEALAGREIPQPVLNTVWTQADAQACERGRLIVCLGAAPGVGKTFAVLGEGQRAKARGTDVVAGVVQTYERPHTIEMLKDLEIIPRRLSRIDLRGVRCRGANRAPPGVGALEARSRRERQADCFTCQGVLRRFVGRGARAGEEGNEAEA